MMPLFLRLRHDILRETAANNAHRWQDGQAMRESLENLGSALLRSYYSSTSFKATRGRSPLGADTTLAGIGLVRRRCSR
jgi:hypothetical protein